MEATKTLETYRDVRPDPPHSEIPSLPRDVTYALNRQTAFNRSTLGASRECGCFHCGRRFPTSLVTGWLEEPGEDDTGLCPYCGTDALVVGDAERPLSTALLAMLYEEWFGEERDERREAANDAPCFAGYDDYLRRSVRVALWPMRVMRRLASSFKGYGRVVRLRVHTMGLGGTFLRNR